MRCPDPGEGVYMQISDQQETLRRIDLIFQVVDPESSDGALLYDSEARGGVTKTQTTRTTRQRHIAIQSTK